MISLNLYPEKWYTIECAFSEAEIHKILSAKYTGSITGKNTIYIPDNDTFEIEKITDDRNGTGSICCTGTMKQTVAGKTEVTLVYFYKGNNKLTAQIAVYGIGIVMLYLVFKSIYNTYPSYDGTLKYAILLISYIPIYWMLQKFNEHKLSAFNDEIVKALEQAGKV